MRFWLDDEVGLDIAKTYFVAGMIAGFGCSSLEQIGDNYGLLADFLDCHFSLPRGAASGPLMMRPTGEDAAETEPN